MAFSDVLPAFATLIRLYCNGHNEACQSSSHHSAHTYHLLSPTSLPIRRNLAAYASLRLYTSLSVSFFPSVSPPEPKTFVLASSHHGTERLRTSSNVGERAWSGGQGGRSDTGRGTTRSYSISSASTAPSYARSDDRRCGADTGDSGCSNDARSWSASRLRIPAAPSQQRPRDVGLFQLTQRRRHMTAHTTTTYLKTETLTRKTRHGVWIGTTPPGNAAAAPVGHATLLVGFLPVEIGPLPCKPVRHGGTKNSYHSEWQPHFPPLLPNAATGWRIQDT